MTRISDNSIPAFSHRSINDPQKINHPIADTQLATPGAKGKIDHVELQRAMASRIVIAASHDLTAIDEGKPLCGTVLFDDTNTAHVVTSILTQVIDENSLRVQSYGPVVIDDSLIEGGSAYDPSPGGDGPFVYWDASQAMYVADPPADSHAAAREVLQVVIVTGGFVYAEICRGAVSVAKQYRLEMGKLGIVSTDAGTLPAAVDNMPMNPLFAPANGAWTVKYAEAVMSKAPAANTTFRIYQRADPTAAVSQVGEFTILAAAKSVSLASLVETSFDPGTLLMLFVNSGSDGENLSVSLLLEN